MKNIYLIFFCISQIYIKLWILGEKGLASEVIFFWNYRLQKAVLLKCLKSPLSEHLWAVNMLRGQKQCLNYHGWIYHGLTRVRTLMHSQHVKGSETLLKTLRQNFFHIFWSRWKKINSKNSILVVFEILRLFVNILTPDDKYSLSATASG